MKIFIKQFIIIITFVFSVNSFSQESTSHNKKVDVKCFVELVGGGERISFWTAPKNKLQKLAKNIVGKEIMTSNTQNTKIIYKVHECTVMTKKFKGIKARQLDEVTPR